MNCSNALGALVLSLSVSAVASNSSAQPSHFEDFDTANYRDAANTTADWNTTDGELRLFPFVPSVVGTYDTLDIARGVAVAGDLAFVADGTSGLQVIDISDPANPTLAGTYNTPGIAIDLAVAGNLAFVADNTSGLQVIDISDPTNPTLAGTYNTSGSARGVAVAGDLVFVADFGSGLQVIDISDPTNPTLAGTYDTLGSAQDVAVAGDLAFVADHSSGLQVIDISDPTNPTLAGTYDTLGYARGVAVDGDLAFVADSFGGLRVIDISDPTNPTLAGAYDTPDYARSVAVDGDLAFVANTGSGLQVIDVSDPTNLTLVGTYDTPDNAYDVVVVGSLAFVADYLSGLQVINISDTTIPTLVSTYDTPGNAWGVAVAGDLAFVADNASGLQVIDISDPTNPTPAGTYDTPGNAWGVAVAGDLALVADYGSGLQLIDISDPTNPTLAGTYNTPGLAVDVAVAGDLAFVADGPGGLQVIDISDPTNPTLAGAHGTVLARGIAVAGNLVFVADGSGGLQVIDISDPTNPTRAGTYSTPGSAYGVAVAGDLAFVADFDSGLQVIDISDPTNPSFVGNYDTPGSAWGVAVAGDLAFVADYGSGLQAIDISDPANPTLAGTYDTPDLAVGVAKTGNLAFVADNTSGLNLIQVSQHKVNPSDNVGRSLALDGATDLILRARLSSTQSAYVSWELSANGGSNFHAVTPGADWIVFAVPGTDLLWRSTHTWAAPGVNPSVSEVTVEWLNEFAPIATIADVPGDQGGRVDIDFVRSGYDFLDETAFPIVGYAIYRRVNDVGLVQTVIGEPAIPDYEVIGALPLASYQVGRTHVVGGRTFVRGSSNATTGTLPPGVWEGVGWVLPDQSDQYTTRVHTLVDSTAVGIAWSVYVTATHTSTPSIWYVSQADSSYSVDNLAPGVPAGITAAYLPDSVVLEWDDAPEPDFQFYRVYRSTDSGFVPSPANLVKNIAVSSWTDPSVSPWNYHYKVSAVDLAGNEGEAGSVTVATGVPVPGAARRFALHAAVPNPFNPSTAISYSIPATGKVRLVIYNVAGREVRTLVDEVQDRGTREVQWNGLDQAGNRVASGVYIYQLRSGKFVETRRMVLLK